MTPEPWPPSAERIAWLGTIVRLAHHHLDGFDGTHDLIAAADLLEDERLAAALALWEAVEWIEANGHGVMRFTMMSNDCRWVVLAPIRDAQAVGDTLPEAVSALKARLNPEKK